MTPKEKREQLILLNQRIAILDQTIEVTNETMGKMVDADSTMGQIVLLWNEKQDVIVSDHFPLVKLGEGGQPPAEANPPVAGIQLMFEEAVDILSNVSFAYPLNNKILIGVLTKLRDGLQEQQAVFEKELVELD